MPFAMLSVPKKEIIFGCFVGVLCTFLLNIYVGSVQRNPCNSPILSDRQKISKNATNRETTDTPGVKKQIILERDNCTTNEHNPANVKLVNSRISNNGFWPYESSSEVCAGKNSVKCLPALPENPDKPQIFTSRTSKTGICIVRKSASRISISLSCMLDDPLKFFYGQKDLISSAMERLCLNENRYMSVEAAQEAGVRNENGWKLVMFVRDPLERFVSGFIHLCMNGRLDDDCDHYCNGCGVDINCFLDRQTRKLEQMVKYQSHVDYGTNHLYPQNWACDLRNHLNNYTFINFRSDSAQFFDEELGPLLQSQNVTAQALTYIRDRMTSTRTKHANTTPELATFLQRKIQSSPQLLEKFLRIFYHDYTTFNVPFPELIK